MKEGAVPKAMKPKHVPYAIRNKVQEELQRLEEEGHLEKIEISEWGAPIMPIIKDNGRVRICGNFKLTLNPQIIIDKYPLPLIDDIFTALQGGETFSEIDLTHAYMQIEVHEECRDMQTIVIHKGLYRYKKLSEGVASEPGNFQRIIESVIQRVDNAIAYLDNIYCTGQNHSEHIKTLRHIFARLETSGFRVNAKKCHFFKDRLDLLGFVIDKKGLHKSEEKNKSGRRSAGASECEATASPIRARDVLR